MRNETCLITGAAGFIGSNLVRALLDNGYKVIGIDNLQTGFLHNLDNILDNENFTFFEDDVNEYNEISEIFYNNKIDYILHYAATVGVKMTLENPLNVFKDITGFENILNLARHSNVKKIFYASSSEVYGEAKQLPMEEKNTPLNSRLPYAIVKNLGEAYLKTYSGKFNLDYTAIRLFNTYGPQQSKSFVISKFISQALRDEDITIYGDGLQTRTFFFIEDHVNFVLNLINNSESVNQVINLGSEKETTMNDLANLIIGLTKSNSRIKHLPPLKEGDMGRRKPDIIKMDSFFPNMDKTSLEEGLIKTIEYFRKFSKDEKTKNI